MDLGQGTCEDDDTTTPGSRRPRALPRPHCSQKPRGPGPGDAALMPVHGPRWRLAPRLCPLRPRPSRPGPTGAAPSRPRTPARLAACPRRNPHSDTRPWTLTQGRSPARLLSSARLHGAALCSKEATLSLCPLRAGPGPSLRAVTAPTCRRLVPTLLPFNGADTGVRLWPTASGQHNAWQARGCVKKPSHNFSSGYENGTVISLGPLEHR